MKSLIPITEIANTVCEDVGDVTKKHQRYILKQMARCYQNLHLFLSGETTVKTEILPVANVIELPADFVYETKVGVKINDKVIFINKNYDQDGNIEKVTDSEFGYYLADTLDPNNTEIDRSVIPFYNYNGELVVHAYGRGAYCDGLYNIDTKNGRILLGSTYPDDAEFVLEYKSDGLSNGVDLVPAEMESCLYNYGLYRYYFNRRDPRYAKSEQDYDIAYYQLESLYRFKPISYISKLYNRFEKETINDFI